VTLVLYCERALSAAPHGLLAEPLNVLSNGAYLAIGMWALKRHGDAHDLKRLGGLALVVGIGSAVFHAAGTRWAMVGDIVPIAVFVIMAWIALRQRVGSRAWVMASAGLGLILMFAAATTVARCQPLHATVDGLRALPLLCLSGGLPYGVVVAALIFATWLARDQLLAARLFGCGAITMAMALASRTLDPHLCPGLGAGGLHLTAHVIWHLGTAITMALVITGLARMRRVGQQLV
jgi:hypothetical protein